MAVYIHPNAQAPTARTNMSAGQLVTGHARYALGPNLVAGDIVKLFNIPNNARVRNAAVVAQKLDNGGTPAIAFNIGDSSNASRYFSASNVGQAGGVAELAVAAAPKGFQYTTDDIVQLTVTTAAATQVSGAYVDVYVDYYLS